MANNRSGNKNEELLEEIRKNFGREVENWKDIRDEGDTDMRYIAGDPWEPAERAAREQKGQERPCLTFDELNQYLNQLGNDVRQNKRAIKIIPTGNGANDKTAQLRSGAIRQIEYKSNAQSAYSTAFEGAIGRSYGYFRISLRYQEDSPRGRGSRRVWHREPVIKRIANPNSVYLDWNAKEADYSDGEHAFVLDMIDRDDFIKKWPDAQIIAFSQEQIPSDAQPWFPDASRIQVAEYWRVEKSERNIVLLDDGTVDGATFYTDGKKNPDSDIRVLPKGHVFEKDPRTKRDSCFLPVGMGIQNGRVVRGATQGDIQVGYPVLARRKIQNRKVMQYITNGVEILEEHRWPGKWIPIIPCFGKELWVDFGNGPRRVLMSMIRLARDPYMLYCWLRSNEQEEAGMTPKVPFLVIKGQTEDCEGWDTASKVPRESLEYKAWVEGMPPGSPPLPAPQRNPFQPNFAAYEQVIESVKRAIQSAMGRYNASVGQHDSSVHSGVQQRQLDAQSDQGSFHFIDNYDHALEYAGRQLLDLLEAVVDLPRDIGVRTEDDQHQVLRVNDPEAINPLTGKPYGLDYDLGTGDHDVTVSTGPSSDSQRDEVNKFSDTLAGIPQLFPRVADLVIRLKNLGPIGDMMADRLTPPEFAGQNGQEPLPPAAIAQIQQAKQQLQVIDAAAQHLQQENAKLEQEKQAKVLELESKERISIREIEARITIAEISAKKQVAMERVKWERDMWRLTHETAHDAGMAAQDHANELEQQQAAAQQAQAEPSQDQAQGESPASEQSVPT